MDEENRCSRIFSHLESLCATAEARRSLHEFQLAYARRTGFAGLLPRGARMDDLKTGGFVSRLFNGRRSFGMAQRKSLLGASGKRASML